MEGGYPGNLATDSPAVSTCGPPAYRLHSAGMKPCLIANTGGARFKRVTLAALLRASLDHPRDLVRLADPCLVWYDRGGGYWVTLLFASRPDTPVWYMLPYRSEKRRRRRRAGLETDRTPPPFTAAGGPLA